MPFVTIHIYYENDKARWVAQLDPLAVSVSDKDLATALDMARQLAKGFREDGQAD